MTVSHETVEQRRSPCGRVRDRATDARTRRGDARRALIVQAVLASAREGNFRPGLVELHARTGIAKTSIVKLFGSLDLLYRVVAREHARAVVDAAGGAAGFFAAERFAWLVMVGKRRELP
ncbi:MAG: hypothetical protein KIS73_24665 [Enhydrobacter sp.]|nr:hypothetical protein [Enhydrobacter sp.]